MIKALKVKDENGYYSVRVVFDVPEESRQQFAELKDSSGYPMFDLLDKFDVFVYVEAVEINPVTTAALSELKRIQQREPIKSSVTIEFYLMRLLASLDAHWY